MTENRTYAMLAKPVSDTCNLRCEYCYYLDKHRLLEQPSGRMSQETLESYTRQLLAIHGKNAAVEFSWHGGEPMAAGLPFFREALRLQEQYGRDRQIINTIQTNATLITDEWCRFFRDHPFEIGVSIDGPEPLHNAWRRKPDGTGSFRDTMAGIERLQKHGIPFTTLTAVSRVNMEHPLEVYDFLKGLTDYLQFLPVVERLAPAGDNSHLSVPQGIHSDAGLQPMAPFSVTPEGFGAFLCAIWDLWHQGDREKIHIQHFDVVLENLMGLPSSLCVHSPVCGHSGSVEANGDVYACDRYTFPSYRLGNLRQTPLEEIMEANRPFGMHKVYGLPSECFDCPYVKLCFGGCPKDRLENGRNYLCTGYRQFFALVLDTLQAVK